MSSPLGASMVAPSTQTYQLLPQPPSTAGACHVTFIVVMAVRLSTNSNTPTSPKRSGKFRGSRRNGIWALFLWHLWSVMTCALQKPMILNNTISSPLHTSSFSSPVLVISETSSPFSRLDPHDLHPWTSSFILISVMPQNHKPFFSACSTPVME